jgi:hypothetical protein
VPFLRLTRDRRGFENTYLMHADRPGDRPRILYWYRTAPGIALGRSPLDEDAIRAIEDQHPEIEFDWPAILALREVMTPEDEAPAPRPQSQGPRREKRPRREREYAAREDSNTARGVDTPQTDAVASSTTQQLDRSESLEVSETGEVPEAKNRLVEELAGREIGARLRARHAEIISRIESLDIDGAQKDALFRRAEAIDPELWMTPEAVLEGVRNADAFFEKMKSELASRS